VRTEHTDAAGLDLVIEDGPVDGAEVMVGAGETVGSPEGAVVSVGAEEMVGAFEIVGDVDGGSETVGAGEAVGDSLSWHHQPEGSMDSVGSSDGAVVAVGECDIVGEREGGEEIVGAKDFLEPLPPVLNFLGHDFAPPLDLAILGTLVDLSFFVPLP